VQVLGFILGSSYGLALSSFAKPMLTCWWSRLECRSHVDVRAAQEDSPWQELEAISH